MQVAFRLLHPLTLQQVGELRDVAAARWARRFATPGELTLAVPHTSHLLGRLLQPDAGIQIVRDGLVEETYWVAAWRFEARDADTAPLWTVTALSLPLALALKAALPAPGTTTDSSTSAGADAQAFSSQTPAQILRALVQQNVIAPGEAARQVATLALGQVLVPAKVAVPPGVRQALPLQSVDPADTTYLALTSTRVRFQPLLDALTAVAQAGGVTLRCRPDPAAGLRYIDVIIPADRRLRVNPPWPVVTFSLARRHLQALTYEVNGFDLVNVAYALGSGTGATRVLGVARATSGWRDLLAKDAPSDPYVVPAQNRLWPRAELALDVRSATTTGDAQGLVADFLSLHQAPESFSVQLGTDSLPGARYLVDWDVGDLVSVDAADYGISGDTRVVEATTEVGEAGDARFTITCGRIPRELGSVVRQALRFATPAALT
jgi:hypothetical protein